MESITTVEGVSDSEREAAWKRIRAAAKKYGVEVNARGWRSLMKSAREGTRPSVAPSLWPDH